MTDVRPENVSARLVAASMAEPPFARAMCAAPTSSGSAFSICDSAMRTRCPPRLVRTTMRIVWSAKLVGMGGAGTIGGGGVGRGAAGAAGGAGVAPGAPAAAPGGGPPGRPRFMGTRSCAVAQLATQCSRAAAPRVARCADAISVAASAAHTANTIQAYRARTPAGLGGNDEVLFIECLL